MVLLLRKKKIVQLVMSLYQLDREILYKPPSILNSKPPSRPKTGYPRKWVWVINKAFFRRKAFRNFIIL